MINLTVEGNASFLHSGADVSFWTVEYICLAVYITIFSILGILGNIPVLIVYLHRKEQIATNSFITALAILDLTVCSLIMPYTLVYELHLVQTDFICRAFEFIRHFTILASNFTLMAIAAERYIAVCRLSHKLSIKNIKFGIILIFIMSCVFATPSIGVFAVVSANEVSDVKCRFQHELTSGKFCHFTFSIFGVTYALIYQGALMVLFFLALVIIVIFYIFVYTELWQRTKFRKRALSKPTNAPEISEVPSSVCDVPLKQDREETSVCIGLKPMYENDDSDELAKETSVLNNNLRTRKKKPEKVRRVFHRRTAKMLFMCTVVYVVTWLPFWIDIFGLSNSLLLRYMFFIGNATNPIVYGIVNTQIRRDFQRLLSRCFRMFS